LGSPASRIFPANDCRSRHLRGTIPSRTGTAQRGRSGRQMDGDPAPPMVWDVLLRGPICRHLRCGGFVHGEPPLQTLDSALGRSGIFPEFLRTYTSFVVGTVQRRKPPSRRGRPGAVRSAGRSVIHRGNGNRGQRRNGGCPDSRLRAGFSQGLCVGGDWDCGRGQRGSTARFQTLGRAPNVADASTRKGYPGECGEGGFLGATGSGWGGAVARRAGSCGSGGNGRRGISAKSGEMAAFP
jgi:hypothetical protein